jgi:hypothetical protein
MRRFELLFITMVLFLGLQSPTLYAWGMLGHATVAQVAENHLTPKAKKALKTYLDGQSIAAIASDADTYRGFWTIDLGFVASNLEEARPAWMKNFDFSTPDNIAAYSHMITVDNDFKCYKSDNIEGEYINNIAYYVDKLAANYAVYMRPFTFSQIRNAGYRLAAILNDIF